MCQEAPKEIQGVTGRVVFAHLWAVSAPTEEERERSRGKLHSPGGELAPTLIPALLGLLPPRTLTAEMPPQPQHPPAGRSPPPPGPGLPPSANLASPGFSRPPLGLSLRGMLRPFPETELEAHFPAGPSASGHTVRCRWQWLRVSSLPPCSQGPASSRCPARLLTWILPGAVVWPGHSRLVSSLCSAVADG